MRAGARRLGEAREPAWLAGLVALFLLSRLAYWLAGLRFAADTYLLGWQFIDPRLLREDLWRSLFYLHSQPPLLNLFTGLVLQGFPGDYGAVFHALFVLLGLALTLSLYGLGGKLGFPKWLAFLLAAWFALSPATVVYENWLSYAYPLTAALVVAGYFLARFLERPRPTDGLTFSLALAAMALTWGLFHLAWLAGCFAIVALAFRGRPRGLLWLLPALCLVLGWYAKNGLLYGSFSASSWAGMNLSKIVTHRLPGEVRQGWARQGLVSDLALLPPFRSREVYLRYFPDTPLTGIPLLDEGSYASGFPNYHSLVHVQASQGHMRDALVMIRLAPRHYLLNVLRAAYIFFHSASDYEHVAGIRAPVDGLDTAWNRAFYGQWRKGDSFAEMAAAFKPGHVAWGLVLAYALGLAGAVRRLWRSRSAGFDGPAVLTAFMLWNVLFVSAAGTLLDIGENNRFRFTIDPFLLLLVALAVRDGLHARRAGRSR